MKYCLFLLQWMVLATVAAAPAKAPRQAPLPPGNRFLFIVETSADMGQLEHGGRQAVFDLIYSGVEGRMRKGDTYGIWTFNETVFAGGYPMQVWNNQKTLEQASAAGRFLKAQKYEKEGRLDVLFKPLQRVLSVAKDLNVLIVTPGNRAIAGTPFDEEINAHYRTNLVQVRETKKPLITTLTARNGKFTGAYVSLAGDYIVLADLPPRKTDAVEIVKAESATADTNEASVAATLTKKPLGQVIATIDSETAAVSTPSTNATVVATESAVTNVEPPAPAVFNIKEIVKTNVVEEPATVVVSPATNPATTPAFDTTAAPTTKEASASKPEPLPAIVPAQMNVSAKTMADPLVVMTTPANVRRPASFASLMLIFGGVFVGGSLVVMVVFARRVRGPKQPSFISQGMDRK